MRDYELTIIFPAALTAEMLEKQQAKIIDLLKRNGVKITKDIKVVKKALAYLINDSREAFYWYQELSAKPEVVVELDKKLKLEDNVVRHLIVKTEIRKTKPEKKKTERA